MTEAAHGKPMTANLFEERFAGMLAQRPEFADSVGARIRIIITGEDAGQWDLDLTTRPGRLCAAKGTPTCCITVRSSDLAALMNREVSPHLVFMSGRLKVAGDVRAAVRLGGLFA